MILELKEIDGKKRTGGAIQIDEPGRTGGVPLTDGETRIEGGGWGKTEDQRLLGALTTATTVAHLFSQPLTIIIGHVDLLLSTIEDSVTRNKLEIIKEQLQSLSMTLQDLRSLREYKTVDFDGLTLLDISLRRMRKLD